MDIMHKNNDFRYFNLTSSGPTGKCVFQRSAHGGKILCVQDDGLSTKSRVEAWCDTRMQDNKASNQVTMSKSNINIGEYCYLAFL